MEQRAVFISHASKDKRLAQQVVGLLEASGVTCWMAPRDIPAGQSYGESIAHAIEGCSVFLLLLTDASNASMPVANEVERAFSYQKTIVPLRLRDVAPSKKIEYYVSGAQWVDAFASPLGERLEHVQAVVAAVEQKRAVPPAEPERPTFGGRFRRFFEAAGRNPLGYGLAASGVLLLACIVALMGWGMSATQDLLAEGTRQQCDALMPMRPAHVACTDQLVKRWMEINSRQHGLAMDIMQSGNRKRFAASQDINNHFQQASRRGDLEAMQAAVRQLEGLGR